MRLGVSSAGGGRGLSGEGAFKGKVEKFKGGRTEILGSPTGARAIRRGFEALAATSSVRDKQNPAMSAKEIPNLKTLLGQRRGGGLRGLGGPGRGGLNSSKEAAADNAVRKTDQDAAGSRVSCVEVGYLHDPYAKLFATQPATRRLPLLNRGIKL